MIRTSNLVVFNFVLIILLALSICFIIMMQAKNFEKLKVNCSLLKYLFPHFSFVVQNMLKMSR